MKSILPAFLLMSAPVLILRGQEARGPLDEHLPNWITLGAQVRFRGEAQRGIGFEEGDRNYLLQRYRLELGIQPLSWLGVFGEFQDSRSAYLPNVDASARDRADIRQGYLRIGNEKGWWDVKAGRQRLAFGSERVIGAAEWGNTARAFDAVKLGIHHKEDRLDIFSSSVVVNSTDTWDHHQEGRNLHGMYGSFGSWINGVSVEPYLLFRTGLSRGWTYGLRTAGKAGPKWHFETEALGQKQKEWAGLVQIQRHFKNWRGRPTLMGETNYASLNLDQLYPTNHGIYGIADQIGRRNTKNFRAGLWVHPEKRLTVKAEGHHFWLADRRGGLYAASGALTVPGVATGALSTDVGTELDVLADIKLSKHYDIGAQFGHLLPGEFLERYTSGAGRSFCAAYIDLHL